MVGYVEIIVELACKAGGGGGDTVRVESCLVGFASTPANKGGDESVDNKDEKYDDDKGENKDKVRFASTPENKKRFGKRRNKYESENEEM